MGQVLRDDACDDAWNPVLSQEGATFSLFDVVSYQSKPSPKKAGGGGTVDSWFLIPSISITLPSWYRHDRTKARHIVRLRWIIIRQRCLQRPKKNLAHTVFITMSCNSSQSAPLLHLKPTFCRTLVAVQRQSNRMTQNKWKKIFPLCGNLYSTVGLLAALKSPSSPCIVSHQEKTETVDSSV